MTETLAIADHAHAELPRPLFSILASASGQPSCVKFAGSHEAAVLPSGPDHVLMVPGVGARSARISSTRLVTPVTDPGQRHQLINQAALTLGAELTSERDTIAQIRRETEAFSDAIRQYAIDRYRDGEICEGGLRKFLRHFDMPPYEPKIRVRFTISGTFLVNAHDVDSVRSDARHGLEVNFEGVDGYDYDSEDVHITIDDCDLHEQD